MLKLVDLEPEFLKRVGDGSWARVESIQEADGVMFLCPRCFLANDGKEGTHSVICWRPRVAPEVDPKPGRWEFEGTSLADLTLVAGSCSILLQGGGCGAHFYIRKGAILFC